MTQYIIELLQKAGLDVKLLTPEEEQRLLHQLKQSKINGPMPEFQILASKEPFYSNAEHAIYSIQQEKATPQQWLAMLTKAGGIKSGEDKWLGLTEWLNGNHNRTIHKNEIINYIELNKITLHEDHYLELEHSEEFKALEQEYLRMMGEVEENYQNADDRYEEFMDEMRAKYDEDDEYRWTFEMSKEELEIEDELLKLRDKYDTKATPVEEIAFSEMVEKYGYHFDYAFSGDSDGLTINDTEEAERFVSAGAIDERRREYVTEGLINYHEIALWAEQAEPWGTNDNLHFGEVGRGRAIGWIRFGETTVQQHLTSAEYWQFLEDMPKAEEWIRQDGVNFIAGNDIYYPPTQKTSFTKEYIVDDSKNGRFIYQPSQGAGIICHSLQQAVDRYNREHVPQSKKQRILVIDEIQSNRHQEGRKKGYQLSGVQLNKINDEYLRLYIQRDDFNEAMRNKYKSDKFGHYMSKEELEQLGTIENKLRELGNVVVDNAQRIPGAPFEKNWHELCMKRMLRYAAENGFDKIAWTKGEQQNKRYDIAKMVHSIQRLENRGDDKYIVIRYNQNNETEFYVKPDGKIYDSVHGWDGKNIKELMGEELAQKVQDMPEMSTLDTKDLTIGNEKMSPFYDRILPTFMNNYGKKWGVTVSEIALPHLSKLNEYMVDELTMHCINVTDEMKSSVLQAQPMFLRDKQGDVYGFTVGDTIYLTEKGLNPETLVHEYTHVWARAMQQGNPDAWQSIKDLLKDTTLWDEVKSDKQYADIHHNEDYIASEALARISGKNNAAKLAAIAQQTAEKNNALGIPTNPADIFSKLRAALESFWEWVGKHMFDIQHFNSINEVTDRVLYDLIQANKLETGEILTKTVDLNQNKQLLEDRLNNKYNALLDSFDFQNADKDNINSRISNVMIFKGKNGEPYIRCKIDGKQQLGVSIKGTDRGTALETNNLITLAERYFHDALNTDINPRQSFKR